MSILTAIRTIQYPLWTGVVDFYELWCVFYLKISRLTVYFYPFIKLSQEFNACAIVLMREHAASIVVIKMLELETSSLPLLAYVKCIRILPFLICIKAGVA